MVVVGGLSCGRWVAFQSFAVGDGSHSIAQRGGVISHGIGGQRRASRRFCPPYDCFESWIAISFFPKSAIRNPQFLRIYLVSFL